LNGSPRLFLKRGRRKHESNVLELTLITLSPHLPFPLNFSSFY